MNRLTKTHKKLSKTKLSTEIVSVCRSSIICLIILLGFMVPFGAVRNIDLQGLNLIVVGGLSLVVLILGSAKALPRLGKLNWSLIGLFASACILSLAVNPHPGYDFLGAPYIRLGTAGLISCVLAAVVIQNVKPGRLLHGLYLTLSLFSLSAIPYSLISLHSIYRLGGLFSQADLMGVFLGVNLILGLEMIRLHKTKRLPLSVINLVLFAELVITQTRVVIYLVILLAGLWYLAQTSLRLRKSELVYIICALLVFVCVHSLVTSNRLTDLNYAQESVAYRLDVQTDALKQTIKKPLLGYGAGNLADALKCQLLPQKPLKKTCSEGYFFNSSHNIFIDRILGIGFIGGLSYLVFVCINLYRALRTDIRTNIYVYIVLLISAYYFTNVTNLELELIFWISLIAMITKRSKVQR